MYKLSTEIDLFIQWMDYISIVVFVGQDEEEDRRERDVGGGVIKQ